MGMRIYQSTPLSGHTFLRLDEGASHHLSRVLRVSVGDKITLFNGAGGEFSAEITSIDKRSVSVHILAFDPKETEAPIDIILAQGIARGEKMDFIVQKAVELGVKRIVPLITERCNVRLDDARAVKRIEHWQSIVINACEQCGRNRLPLVSTPIHLTEWLANSPPADRSYVLSPHRASLAEVRMPLTVTAPVNPQIALLIGPEGGLSEREQQQSEAHGFLPLNLGRRILRAETATIAAVTAMQCWFGDYGQ